MCIKNIKELNTFDLEKSKITNRNTTYKQFGKCTYPKVYAAFILFVLHFILLVGNIESNPGPESAYISSTRLSAVDILSGKFISICNINIRRKRNKINFLL
jgi:hypothetical protein